MFIKVHNPGLQMISRMVLVKWSGQTYFCSDKTHLWPDKGQLRHTVSLSEVLNYISLRRVNDQTKHLLIHEFGR